jgi:hypothetical protein
VITLEDMQEILKEKPFEFKEATENLNIARYIMANHGKTGPTAKAKDIAGRLFMELPDWTILTPDVEKELDAEITA